MIKVMIPKLGVSMESAKISKWHKSEGDSVDAGEVLLSVETDKALFDVEAEHKGTVSIILAKEGETVPIHNIIAIITEIGEKLPSIENLKKENEKNRLEYLEKFSQKREIDKKKISQKETVSISRKEGISVKATPKGRMMAKELNVDLQKIEGSGPGGIITAEDVIKRKNKVDVLILNASVGGRVVFETLLKDSLYNVVGFIDDDPKFKGLNIEDVPCFGSSAMLKGLKKKGIENIFVAVGNVKQREIVAKRVLNIGFKLINVIHPKSSISYSAKLGRNVWVKEMAVIERNTVIGDNVIVDSGAIVSHDNVIGDCCHLSPGCRFGGTVIVGKYSIIGVGASIAPYVKIGENVLVSPGSAVLHNIPDFAIVEGVPGRIVGFTSKTKT